MVADIFNPSTWRQKAGRYEFKDSLVFRVSSKTVRATKRNCLENQNPNQVDTMEDAYNPSTSEAEAEGSRIQS